MNTPAFWQSKNLVSTLLLPLSWLYLLGTRLRRAGITPMTLPVPVLCIGNLTAGGAGKTPVALHIGRKCRDNNIGAFFLSRGYGGSFIGAVVVDPHKHTAAEVGDEPLLLAQVLPTVVAKDRESGARLAIAQGAKVIIMDDGFQNPSLAKTFSFVVIDGQTGLGNGRLLPAGPLREPALSGLGRADAVIIVNPGSGAPTLPPGAPVLHAHVQPGVDIAALRGKKTIAFCGMAYPQKFFGMLALAGVTVLEKIAFADHHPYTPQELEALAEQARQHQAALVTTTKDAVRLPADFRAHVTVVDITLAFDNEEALDNLLTPVLNRDGKN